MNTASVVRVATFAILLIFVSGAYSQESERKLSGYQPSYFYYARDGVDDHIEFNVSVKYPVDENVEWLSRLFGGKSSKLYIAYTGQYDFFVFSEKSDGRDSAPIVSRIQNPGAFFKYEFDADEFERGFKNVSVGWFHESNGQQIEDRDTFLDTVNASDYVSRGWDYLGIDTKYRLNDFLVDGSRTNIYTRLRIFCNCQGFGSIGDKEDDISVFGVADTASIRNFDGLRFVIDHRLNDRWNYAVKLRTGLSSDEALDNWSYTLELNYWWDDIPLSLNYFDGYGANISTYHIKDDYIGFGIKVW